MLFTRGEFPGERIFCHTVYTSQGLDPKNLESGGGTQFSRPGVAFSPSYRPGFSTYPVGVTFKTIFAVVAAHGSPRWISAEGANVGPNGMSGEPNMETYMGRLFNYGAVRVNAFSWGIGGEAERSNFFRKATENPEALRAYAKFLRGEKLLESAATGFSSEAFQAKMRRIQAVLPGWVQKSGKQAQVMPLIQKLQALIKEKKWQEADNVADQLLGLLEHEKPDRAKTEGTTTDKSGAV
jgi:hypothetical protein